MLKKSAMSILLLATACSSESKSDNYGRSCEVESGALPRPADEIDILLVVDDSTSMASRQEALQANLVAFGPVLENMGEGNLSVHLAVVSGDTAGSAGAFQNTPLLPNCSPPTGHMIEDVRHEWWTCSDSGEDRCADGNHSETLGETIACIATLGSAGSENQSLLEAAKLALDGSNSANSAFLRPNAFLSVMFITDADDGSVEAPSVYADYLKSLKSEQSKIMVSSVRPLASPRLEAFETEFPTRNYSTDIDLEDWSDVLSSVANRFAPTLGYPCLEATVLLADNLPDVPGLQPDCVATHSDSGMQDTVIPPCSMAAPDRPAADTTLPCWRLVQYDSAGACRYSPRIEVSSTEPIQAAALRCTCE